MATPEEQALQDAILQQSIEEQQAEEASATAPGQQFQGQSEATPGDLAAGEQLRAVTKDPREIQRDALAAREASIMDAGGATDPFLAAMPTDPNGPGVLERGGQVLAGAHNTVSALGGGAVESGFQAYDFFAGPTPEDQKSDFRQWAEKKYQGHMDALGTPGGLIGGLGQFAGGMVGTGKFTEALKVVPWIGKGLSALEGTLFGRAALTETKAAVVAGTMFDPHQERLSNLLVQFPIFQNSVTRYLAADPKDTDGEGRLKNVIEGLGLSAAVGGLYLSSVKLYKALAGGNRKAIAEASDEVLKAQQKAADGASLDVNSQGGAPAANPNGAAIQDAGGAARSSPEVSQGEVPQVNTKPRFSVTTNPDGTVTFTPKQFLDAAEGKSGTGDLTATPGSPNSGASVSAGGDGNVRQDALGAGPAGDRGVDGSAPPLRAAPGDGEPLGGVVPGGANAGDTGSVRMGTGEAVPPGSQASGELSAVPNATEGLAQEGVTGANVKPKGPQFEPALVDKLLKSVQKDWDALDERGWSWEDAIADGHKFASNPNSIPYNKLGSPEDVRALIDQVSKSAEGWLNKAKGGAVLTDATVTKRIGQWSEAFNLDPASVMGDLASAGKAAHNLVVQMEAGYQVANRSFQDATSTAWKITNGVLDAFQGDAGAAQELLKQQLAVAAQALGHANSIRAAGGRIVRRGRAEFAPKASDIAALRAIDGDMLATLVSNAKGDIKNLRLIANPTVWSRLTDAVNFLYINNLLWGWKSHVVNLMSNGYMMMSRPAERIIGSLGMGNVGASVREEAYRQYYYMGASLFDSFRAAKEAFILGDSKIAPHTTELYKTAPQPPGVYAWKPWDSPANIGYNALVGAGLVGKNVLGMPTRLLGAADEMMKVITYRSMVMSKAYMEAQQIVRSSGLTGEAAQQEIKRTISKRLGDAFDDMGRATDMDAKREAQIATFSQDLLPGTFGKGVQNFTNSVPAMRLILPFVKTPTNIIRYSWKLTPGLNLLQKEFRQALAGELGDTPEIAARNKMQARGQLALSTAFLGAAGYLASQGIITGGGPADPKARKDLMATGWRPYSIRTVNPDGTVTYNALGSRMDPLVMPFGIVADIVAAAEHPEGQNGVDEAATSLAIALAKNITNRTYLVGLSQALEALTTPTGDKANAFFGGMAANMVPASSMLRQVNPDPYLRDARSIADRVTATIPGLSDKLPPRRDTWGDPMLVQRGFSSTADGLVDQEMERLILDTPDGRSIAAVTPTGSGYDLREVTMVDGRNAYDRYQELSGHLPGAPSLKSQVAKVMQTEAYRKAPDGSSSVKGTKLYMLGSVINPYHEKAKKVLMKDPNVRKAMYTANEQVRAAYALKQRDPNGAIPQRNAVNRIMETFGLGGFGGGDSQ